MDIFYEWKTTLIETYRELLAVIVKHVPDLLMLLLLFTLGLVVAFFISKVVFNVIDGLDKLFQKVIKGNKAESEKIKKSYAKIISSFIFWLIALFFINVSVNLVGWTMFNKWFDGLVNHLPNLFAGLLIILLGVLFANLAKSALVATTKIKSASLLASITQFVVLFTAFAIGIEQIGINIAFLTSTITMILGVFLAGGVLAFGLGAKTLISNIIASQYVSKICNIGDHLTMGDVDGKIIEITQTKIILEAKEGRLIIPAKYFNEQISLIK